MEPEADIRNTTLSMQPTRELLEITDAPDFDQNVSNANKFGGWEQTK